MVELLSATLPIATPPRPTFFCHSEPVSLEVCVLFHDEKSSEEAGEGGVTIVSTASNTGAIFPLTEVQDVPQGL